MTKIFKHGEKKQTAIQIIEENHDKDFYEVCNMISIALDINKYSARSYYKYMVKNGWVSKVPAESTPWKDSKAKKTADIAEALVKATSKAKAKSKTSELAAAKEPSKKKATSTKKTAAVTEEKPATAMIREFVRKQKAAARQA